MKCIILQVEHRERNSNEVQQIPKKGVWAKAVSVAKEKVAEHVVVLVPFK